MEKIINYLPNMINELSYGCLCIDEYGDILYANKTICQMLEYDESEILKKKVWEINNNIKNLEEFNKNLDEISNNKSSNIIVDYIKKNGENITSRCLPSIYIDENNKRICFSIIKNIDINYNNIFLTKDLEKYIQLGEMIENILHQWKTPISLILTTTSGVKLKKELDNLREEDYLVYIDYIEKSAKYLNSVIDTFKCFFNKKSNKENFLMDEIINNAFFLLSSKLKNSDIKLIVNNYDKKIYSYKQLFIQIILILVNNSIDAINTLNGNKNYIFVDTFVEEKQFYFIIKDSAGGVDNEILEKIFDYKFTTKGDNGTGLGLYMIKTILNREFSNSLITCKNKSFNYGNEKLKGLEFVISFEL